jgi:Chaperone of endosialidase
MPSDDLVLNVRQIANYPPTADAFLTDMLLLQRGGIGGPYQSISAPALVATALAGGGGPLAVSTGYPPADAVAPQIFTDNLVVALGATHNWNCYFSSATNSFAYTTNGPAAAAGYDAVAGFLWGAAPAGAAGAPAPIVDFMQLTPDGELVLIEGSVTLGHDPIGPMQAATAQWVGANTVGSFNGRQGVVTLWITDIVGAGGAQIRSPRFQGTPRAPTPPEWSNSSRLATTAFVQRNSTIYLNNLLNDHPFVFTFNGRSGAIVLTEADITAALGDIALPFAPIDSPNFTGYATAPTPPPGTVTGQIATTAFVMNAVAESTAGVASFNGRTGIIALTNVDITAAGGAPIGSPAFTGVPSGPTAAPGANTAQLATTAFVAEAVGTGFAPLDSPNFTGLPTAPTADVGTNDAQLATTAFVMAAIPEIDAGVLSFNGRVGAVTLLANDVSAAGGATLVSPPFSGTPTAPTAPPSTNSTQLATTAFVTAAIALLPTAPLPSTATPLMNGTPSAGSALTYSRGDHIHPSDTSRLALSGGTLTGTLNGTLANFSGSVQASTMQINNGQLQITRGTATNPVIFFNDGTTNRVSLYFNVSSGQTTLVDNYSGSNIVMGPGATMALNAGTVSASGGLNVAGQFSVQGFVLTASGGYLYSTSGFMAPVLRFSSSLLNPGAIPLVGDIANMAFASAPGSPTGIAFQGTNAANTVAYFVWTDAGSDIRIKENIAATQVDALAAILSIPVRQFDFRQAALNAMRPKGGARLTTADYHVPIGLVAQEVMGIIPDMDVVVTQPEGHDPALPSDLHAIVLPNAVPFLIRAIQQLEMRVRDLEGRTLQ